VELTKLNVSREAGCTELMLPFWNGICMRHTV
jgi:hypothetical protein